MALYTIAGQEEGGGGTGWAETDRRMVYRNMLIGHETEAGVISHESVRQKCECSLSVSFD